MYYCIARYYDPELMRFTGRDPVEGSYEEPLTLHKYLYCGNDSINRTDPTGENYSGAMWQAKELSNKMSAFSAALAEGIDAANGDPWAKLDFAIGTNAVREAVFSVGGSMLNAAISAKSNYFGDDKSFINNLFIPADAYNQPEECQVIDGYFRHCVGACRVNRCTLGLFPALTFAFALSYSEDWPYEGEPIDAPSDRRAYLQGIINSYNLLKSCYDSCKESQREAIDKYCK
jgi:hypothetical protein